MNCWTLQLQSSAQNITVAVTRMQTVTRRDGLSTAPVNLVTKEMGFSVSPSTGNKSFLLLRFFKQLENVAKNININSLFAFRCIQEPNGGCSDFASCKFVGPVSENSFFFERLLSFSLS